MTDLSFEALLGAALGEWPDPIYLHLRRLPGEGLIVDGLTDLSDDLSEKHHGQAEEILFSNLHWAIATAVHRSARSWPGHMFRMRPNRIRRDWIREKFEDDLTGILSESDSTWTPEDLDLARRYKAARRGVMTDWAETERSIDEILRDAGASFASGTLRNVRDFVDLGKSSCAAPDGVTKGYRNTIRLWWGNLEFEIFRGRIEVYRFHEGRTDIRHEAHSPGAPFPATLIADLPSNAA